MSLNGLRLSFPHKPLVIPGFRLRVSERRKDRSYNDRFEILVTKGTESETCCELTVT